MFPLHDDNPTRRRPVVTYGIVALCALVWFGVQGAGLEPGRLQASVCALGAIPAEVVGGAPTAAGPCGSAGLGTLALVTSMFLHGGWFHLVGNLWFLWIFGNNVEDTLGRFRFAAFYVLAGLAAALAHVASDPGSPFPMVGASGAISGVMGAYLVLFPRARVKTLLFLVLFVTVVELPAYVYLGYWFVVQLAAGGMGQDSGVAFWAHVGGFAAGVLLLPVFRPRGRGGPWASPARGV